ncbi:hypothetical protein [Janibacter sp. LM]|uniref:hypothetical protein n=1 Tax=Janibacter sp. LM TaxID=3144845 RepID=UPI0031F6CBA2
MPNDLPTTDRPADTAQQEGVPAADLDAFDLDDFLAGVVAPTRTVAVSQDRTLGQQARKQMALIEELERDAVTARAEGRKTTRRAAATRPPELEAAHQRLAELERAAEGTFVWVRVEAIDPPTQKQAARDASGGTKDDYNRAVIALTARVHKRDPRAYPDAPGAVLSAEQWEAFSIAVGFVQWQAIVDATIEVNAEGVMPGFSQQPSHSPGGGTSSES